MIDIVDILCAYLTEQEGFLPDWNQKSILCTRVRTNKNLLQPGYMPFSFMLLGVRCDTQSSLIDDLYVVDATSSQKSTSFDDGAAWLPAEIYDVWHQQFDDSPQVYRVVRMHYHNGLSLEKIKFRYGKLYLTLNS